MAYTLPNTGIIRPWSRSRNRYIHRQLRLTVPNPTATVEGSVSIPCPGRLIAISYSGPNATESLGVGAALTSGALTLKAETTAGVQIFTDAALSSVSTIPSSVGTTAKDEGNAATAATDGFSGGFPVRQGVFASLASGTADEVLVIDMWFRLCTWVKLNLSSQSGADGSGVVTRSVPLGNAGVLSAIAIDYQNMPVTTDIVVYADSANGPALFTNTSSSTDLAPTLLGNPGIDEAVNVTAATDGTECGLAFKKGLYIDVAQADAFTTGNEVIVMELWIDD